MSYLTYDTEGRPSDKPVMWLDGFGSPPMTKDASREAAYAVRQVQRGTLLSMPLSSPMPEIGSHCHELRIRDVNTTWRIIYRIDSDAVIIVHVFAKKTGATPENVKALCRKRLSNYDENS